MATLHGVLAELGIEAPYMHSGSEGHASSQWVIDQPFSPVEGKSYELAYGAIPYGDDAERERRPLVKRVRIDGPGADDWYDLETSAPFDRELHDYAVRGFRELPP